MSIYFAVFSDTQKTMSHLDAYKQKYLLKKNRRPDISEGAKYGWGPGKIMAESNNLFHVWAGHSIHAEFFKTVAKYSESKNPIHEALLAIKPHQLSFGFFDPDRIKVAHQLDPSVKVNDLHVLDLNGLESLGLLNLLTLNEVKAVLEKHGFWRICNCGLAGDIPGCKQTPIYRNYLPQGNNPRLGITLPDNARRRQGDNPSLGITLPDNAKRRQGDNPSLGITLPDNAKRPRRDPGAMVPKMAPQGGIWQKPQKNLPPEERIRLPEMFVRENN
jgi:hypothetical protein